MSFDGVAEANNINARIGALVGGQVWEGAVPDGHTLNTFADGRIKPYIITKFATPVASGQDRGMALGEQSQPYIFSGTATAYAADAGTARITIAAATNLLTGWGPNGANASDIKLAGGYSFTRVANGSTPTRHEAGVFFECIINLSTS